MITTDHPFEALGIEDEDLWKKSGHLLSIAQSNIRYFLTVANKIKNYILSLRVKLSDTSLEIDKQIEKYNEEVININDYFLYLKKKANSVDIDLNKNYPNFILALKTFKNPYMHLYYNISSLMNTIHNESKRDKGKELIISPKKAISRLVESEEITKLERELRTQMCMENHLQIIKLFNNIELLINLTNMQGTPYQFLEFKKNRHEFSSDFFKEELLNYSILLEEKDMEILDTFVPIMEKFYELTKQRQIHYVKKSIENMDKTYNNLAAMLVMGFNTNGISNLLSEKYKITNYVVNIKEEK